jgi:NAD-dependent SIR2 family protein deacetylase
MKSNINNSCNFTLHGQGRFMEAYCVKCKAKTEIKDAEETQTKNGRTMMKGKCPTCGTTCCRIVGKNKPADQSQK